MAETALPYNRDGTSVTLSTDFVTSGWRLTLPGLPVLYMNPLQ